MEISISVYIYIYTHTHTQHKETKDMSSSSSNNHLSAYEIARLERIKFIQNEIKKIGALKKILTSWRKADNSLSSSVFQKLMDGFRVYHIYMNFNRIKSMYFLLVLSLITS